VSRYWSAELWRLFALLLATFLIGLLLGQPLLLLLLGIIAYLAWHLRNIFRLQRWLIKGKKYQPPEAHGIWGKIFHLIYQLQQRNRKRKRRLADIVNRFQQATSALPDATVVVKPGGEIEWFNKSAERLLGLNSPADVGQRIDNLIRNPEFSVFLGSPAKGNSIEIPSTVDELVILNVRLIPYGKKRRLLVARDVSQRLRLERMRRDFIANVSHELRTPLTVINGYLETIQDDEGKELEPWKDTFQVMQQQNQRMQHLVDDLLLLSNLESEASTAKGDCVDVPVLLAGIREAAELLAAEKKLSICLKCDERLKLLGSERELYSAFSNLVSNAVRYTPSGGEITLRWYADKKGAHFEVTDTGIGIAAQHIPRLTERFYRVDVGRSRESGGTGLGLAIVKHVLNRHDAQLLIESQVGIGSTFSCLFPAHRIDTGETQQSPERFSEVS
jgi:two-component system phosphate regulon sensor histidine kinase PhoR